MFDTLPNAIFPTNAAMMEGDALSLMPPFFYTQPVKSEEGPMRTLSSHFVGESDQLPFSPFNATESGSQALYPWQFSISETVEW